MCNAKWAVIGAGPAGIAAVGKLLEEGIEDIIWIDKNFKVGNFSSYPDVPSNTKAGLFVKFLRSCKAFGIDEEVFKLFKLDPDKNCKLVHIIEPLQWATESLREKVYPVYTNIKEIEDKKGKWHLTLEKGTTLEVKNVIMATGGLPKFKDENNLLTKALNMEQCEVNFNKDDVVAVYGSSHSAILAIKNLLNVPVKKVYNFYKSPLKYAVYFSDHILFDDSGLKGEVAAWAKEKMPKMENLERHYEDNTTTWTHKKLCNKRIHATGFNPTRIEIVQHPKYEYDPYTGIIAPGMFGCGLAFPELFQDRYGHEEHRVGLWKFMDFLNRVMPIWLKYS